KLIPLMVINALQDRRLPIYGDGQNVRDWLYVEDNCEALDLILHGGKAGETYNIGANEEWRNIDVVKVILKHLGKPESLIEFVKDRPGHDRRYSTDASKVGTELGWRPSRDFAKGLKMTVDWYSSHAEWWKRVMNGEYQSYYRKVYEER
ncbi:MAG TPA: GDP-mannose 4,6-dehydratase, partial [Bacteroidota bacterium]